MPGPVAPTPDAACRLRPVPLGAVTITGGLWAARRQVNGDVAVPSGRERLESAGNLDNLRIAAGTMSGEPRGPVFMDSDVYKWLEAAAWEYARRPSEELLEAQREITAIIAAAQQPDGYLDSIVQLEQDGERYRELGWSHEHYCAGHLFQAAVAQVRCTGDRGLLDVAVRLADHLVRTFGENGRHDLDGHPEVEMALVELYRETGTRDYLDLARYFVEARGRERIVAYGREPAYFADRVPVREQTTVEGHAVRAVYLGAGAADVAVELGDAELLAALERQFAAMEATKTYVTGGLGSRWDGEAFGDPYELPPDRAYAETCAAIGGVYWAWRMLLATGDPRYADAAERKLFNGFLAGVSLSGDEFFYVNPLHLREDALADESRSPAHGRRPWFDVACCPPNIMRTLASLPGYLATTDDDGVQLHQYAPSVRDGGGAGWRGPDLGGDRVPVGRPGPDPDRGGAGGGVDPLDARSGMGRGGDAAGRRRGAVRPGRHLRARDPLLAARGHGRAVPADDRAIRGGRRAGRRRPGLRRDRTRSPRVRRRARRPGRRRGGRRPAPGPRRAGVGRTPPGPAERRHGGRPPAAAPFSTRPADWPYPPAGKAAPRRHSSTAPTSR